MTQRTGRGRLSKGQEDPITAEQGPAAERVTTQREDAAPEKKRRGRPATKKATNKRGGAVGKPKPIAAPPRPKYGLPSLGEAGELPPREGDLDPVIKGIIEATVDHPGYVPVLDEERAAQALQAAITAAARRLGRPIKTTIRIDPDTGKQVVYARGL